MRKRTWFSVAAILILAAAAVPAAKLVMPYTKDGGFALPDYRKWVYLGSGLGMSYTGQNSENPPFTNVFAEPSAYDAFMRDGVWPDKTILVAEMRGSATNLSINKSGRAQTEKLVAVEVEVKDKSKGGWSFYGYENGATVGKLFPRTESCYSCHEQHASTDNTFVQFYPTLIATAKAKGTFKETGH